MIRDQQAPSPHGRVGEIGALRRARRDRPLAAHGRLER